MKVKIIFTLLLYIYTIALFSQATEQSIAAATKSIEEEHLVLLEKHKIVGFSMAIIDNGKVVYANGFGFQDRAQQIPATAQTNFRIGSCTKTFTAIAILQLHEKGLLNIEESIKKYLPELTISSRFGDGNEIFIKDILSHTSGLPCDVMNGFGAKEVPDMDWVIAELNKQTTISPPNYLEEYSNVGYGLLSELVKRVSGQSYADYVADNILRPLEMSNSEVGMNPEKLAKAYLKKETFSPNKVRDIGAGALTSSAADMGNFILMLTQKGKFKEQQILSEKSMELLETNHLLNNFLPEYSGYGYGVTVQNIVFPNQDKARLIGHGGSVQAFHCSYRYIPELQVGVVIMTNTDVGIYVCRSISLIDDYLQKTRGNGFEYSYDELTTIDDSAAKLSDAELLGAYNLGMALLTVDNANKIKFKVDGTKVVLRRKGETNAYSITAKLLGFIPLKIKDVDFVFEKREDLIYLKQRQLDDGTAEFLAIHTPIQPIPKNWRSKIGNYQVTNAIPTTLPIFDFQDAKVTLSEEVNFLVLKIEAKKNTYQYYLNMIAEDYAVSGGVGRNAGYIVRILENGHLYFSGFEFEQVRGGN